MPYKTLSAIAAILIIALSSLFLFPSIPVIMLSLVALSGLGGFSVRRNTTPKS